jgi:hypothetical protein
MNAMEKYQQLIDAGLIVPAKQTPRRFKFPSLLVSVPSITTNRIIKSGDRRDRTLNAQLDRYTK